jgi:hypothetical protein
MKKRVLLVTSTNLEQDARETCHGCGEENSVSVMSVVVSSLLYHSGKKGLWETMDYGTLIKQIK